MRIKKHSEKLANRRYIYADKRMSQRIRSLAESLRQADPTIDLGQSLTKAIRQIANEA
jgi:hypothetical protein